MSQLLDINILIALAWPSHIHHDNAHSWFGKNAKKGWATCPVTQIGFVRISSNPKIIQDAVSPREAVSVLREMTAHRNHEFWPDDISIFDSKIIPLDLLAGHRQVTDSYLIGLSIERGGRLITFDRGMASLFPTGSAYKKAVEVIS